MFDLFGLGGSEGYTITNRYGTTVYDGQGNVTEVSATANPVSQAMFGTFEKANLNPLSWGGILSQEWDDLKQGLGRFIPSLEDRNQDRLASKISRDSSAQSTDGACSWWNIACKAANAVSATGDFIQSTLLKIIVVVLIISITAIFFMSYIQAKAGRLA